MDNIRDGATKVFMLKWEIRKRLEELRKTGYRSRLGAIQYLSRIERQIKDGERFLEMLDTRTYSSCKTVDELKQKIAKKRNMLKMELTQLDPKTGGHQISIFEIIDDIPKEEKNAREVTIDALKDEIHWLHKCLGICKNKDYFK